MSLAQTARGNGAGREAVMLRRLAGGLAGAAAMALAGGAEAQVGMTVTGGGNSLACAASAKKGETGVRVEQTCTTALETEPMLPMDRAGTYVNRGVIRLRGQRYGEAVTDFDTALDYKADFAEAYVNRGAARIGLRKFADALSDLNKAITLGVQEPEKAYYNRALAHEWLDDPKSAWLDYQKALALAPDWDLVKQQLTRFTVSHADVAIPATAKP
jgi:tetratricopeptide (TPR) repeat protein